MAVEVAGAAAVAFSSTLGIKDPGTPTATERVGRAILTVASSASSLAEVGAATGGTAGIFTVWAAAKSSTVTAGIATVGRFVTAGAGVGAGASASAAGAAFSEGSERNLSAIFCDGLFVEAVSC